MKKAFLLAAILGVLQATAQDGQSTPPEMYTAHNKGKFYISWGGNRESFSKSDVTFTGDNYHFTIDNMEAHDKPKGWHIDYINPVRLTIPQTDFRLGYYISDHYSISAGWDHMKYVMTQFQTANMTGYINTGEGYDGVYNHQPTVMTEDFLTYEHTDGLNYINAEFARHDDVSQYVGIVKTDWFQINLSEGLGAGVLYPKTNTKLMGRDRHDEFHISGYGVSGKAALNLTILKHFYVQGELKGGYINMPDIRTTYSGNDRASQEFFFFQRIIELGAIFRV